MIPPEYVPALKTAAVLAVVITAFYAGTEVGLYSCREYRETLYRPVIPEGVPKIPDTFFHQGMNLSRVAVEVEP